MAEYDIASKVVPPKIDPLAVAGQATQLQGALLNTKLLGANVAQTLAQRAAAQSAVDPATGQFDVDKYEAALASGGASPEALLQAQQTRQAQLQTQISKLGLTTAQLSQSQQELGNGAQVAQGVLANGMKNPSLLSKDAIAKAIDENLIQPGLVRSPEGLAHAKSFEASLTDDPKQNAALLQQFINQSTDINKAMGQVQGVDTGGNIAMVRVNPATAQPSVSGVIDKSLSPSEENTPAYSYVDKKTGITHIVTKGAAAAAPPGTAPASIESGMGIGTPELAGQGVKFRSDLAHAASSWGDVNATLGNFGSLVDKIASGPKAGALKQVGQFAAQFGLAPPTAKDDTAALEEAGKLAYQIAQRQFQQLGGTGTDSKLDSAMHTSPSEFLSQLGNKRIIALLRGNNDAIKAEQNAYETWAQSHGPQEYSEFIRQWNQHYDPRAFQAAYMTPAQVKELRSGMSTSERANFDAFSAFAKKQGWLNGG